MTDTREENTTPPGTTDASSFTREELQLSARNHGLPLEALRYPVTPVGLHYLLVHYDIPAVDPDTWRLQIDGAVARPLTLSLAELQRRPQVTSAVTLECAGNGRALHRPRALSQPWLLEAVGTGAWTGTPLTPLFEEAGVAEGAVELRFTGLDRGIEGGVAQAYARSLPLHEARGPGPMLAWGLNGQPLPPQHGFPVRLVVPGYYGMAHVKWLARITALTEADRGYQQLQAYRLRQTPDEEGAPVTRIEPRALMIPPGIPDFFTRRRYLAPGPCVLAGRAWSGWGLVTGVDVSVDGGRSWAAAELEPGEAVGRWQGFSRAWTATPGEHVLCCRARDASGRVQPDEILWNLGGYAGNAVQRIAVTVR